MMTFAIYTISLKSRQNPQYRLRKFFGTFCGPKNVRTPIFRKLRRRFAPKHLLIQYTPRASACKSRSKSLVHFLQTVVPRFENCAGPLPQSRGKSEKVGVLLHSGWGIESYFIIKPCRSYILSFRFSKFQKFAPPLRGGRGAWGHARPFAVDQGRSPENFVRLSQRLPEIFRFEKFRPFHTQA